MMERRIKMEVGDSNWLKSELVPNDVGELRVAFVDAEIVLPPHSRGSKSFLLGELLVGAVTFAGNVAAGVVAAYLYDALKSGKLRRLFIAGKGVHSEEEIKQALENENSDA